jgi:hypothetical protein
VPDTWLQSDLDAIDYGQAKGVIYVFSATNGNNEGRMYPAAYAGVVAVTNVDYKGVRHRPRGNQIFNPTSMRAQLTTRGFLPCFENSTRIIDPSKNQPNRRRCDRAREF